MTDSTLINNKTAAFDHAANQYDKQFTNSKIGQLQRSRVYQILTDSGFFSKPKNVFEINCGTGADAIYFSQKGHKVTATDASEKMIEIAKAKSNEYIHFYSLNFQDIAKDANFKKSEVLFSNFGGLNCLSPAELNQFFSQIAQIQTKGNQIVLVVMSKKCLMEQLYFMLKGQWKKMNRRNTSDAVEVNWNGKSISTFYYFPKEMFRMLESNYQLTSLKPLAFFLPPSYLEPFFVKHPIGLKILSWLENKVANFKLFASRSDHYLLIAERL
mgnify:CR=1 FL=1